MASGDWIDATGTQYTAAAGAANGKVFWFAGSGSHVYRKYVMNDGATAAENGVYQHVGGADYVKLDVQLNGDTATVRIWEQSTIDGQLPAATSEIHQVGSNMSADASVTVTEVSEFMKSEVSAHSAGTGGVQVIMEAHYLNGRP